MSTLDLFLFGVAALAVVMLIIHFRQNKEDKEENKWAKKENEIEEREDD